MRRLEQLTSLAARSLFVTIICGLMVATASLALLRHDGDQLLSVQTASMVPTFKPGDAVFTTPISVTDLKAGEIISYRNPAAPGVIISHRLLAIDRRTGHLTTAGDALHSTDPPFASSFVVGRVTAVAPGFGTLINFLRRPFGLLLAVYLPAVGIIIYEGHGFTKACRRPHYQHLSYR